MLLKFSFICDIIGTSNGGLMSKQLAKILTICALIVLLPFIIVGSALTFTEAVGVTLTIAQAGQNASQSGTSSEIGIYINDQKQENTIEVRKNTTVTLSYSGEGYHFYGWYQGDASQINVAENEAKGRISTQTSFAYVVSGTGTVTAMRDVQKYNITYTGLNADGTTLAITSQEGVEYNTALPVLDDKYVQIFLGWRIQGSQDVPSFKANFDATNAVEEVVLEPVWKTDLTFTVNFNVNDNSAENAVSLSYNATNGLLSQYTKERENYTFVGLKIQGSDKLYSNYTEANGVYDYYVAGTQEKLSDALLANKSATVYAVWNSVYPTISFNYQALAWYEDDIGEDYLAVYENGVAVKDLAYVQYTFGDETGIEIQDIVIDQLLDDYSTFKTSTGLDVQFANSVFVYVAGTKQNIGEFVYSEDPFTFQNFIEDIAFGLDTEVSELEGMSFDLKLIFEVVA